MHRVEIEECLREVGAELRAKGLVGEIVIVGGAWMTLVLESREATRDVDAYLAPEHAAAIREATRIVARRHELPDDWLNDAVKGSSQRHPMSSIGPNIPACEFRRLRPTTCSR